MMRRRFVLLGAILAGIAMAGLAPPARAGFEVTFSDGTNSWQVDQSGTVTTAGTGSGTVTSHSQTAISGTGINVGGYTITFTALTNNSPGSAAIATMNLANVSITHSGSSTANLTITEQTTGGSFTAPAINPVTLTSGLTSTWNTGNSGSISLTSSISSGGSTGESVTQSLANANASVILTTHTVPFDLKQVFSVSLTDGNSISTMDGTTSVTAPEPTSMAMGLVGIGTLAFGGWYRRSRKA